MTDASSEQNAVLEFPSSDIPTIYFDRVSAVLFTDEIAKMYLLEGLTTLDDERQDEKERVVAQLVAPRTIFGLFAARLASVVKTWMEDGYVFSDRELDDSIRDALGMPRRKV